MTGQEWLSPALAPPKIKPESHLCSLSSVIPLCDEGFSNQVQKIWPGVLGWPGARGCAEGL